MSDIEAGGRRAWRNYIRLSVLDGKLRHSGQKKPLRVKITDKGVRVGCTLVTHEAMALLIQLVATKARA